MKKTLIIMLLVLVALTGAFATSFKSIGVETGSGILVSADIEITEKLDVYARTGYDGQFNLSGGVQYKVAELKLGSSKIDVKPGIQADFSIGNWFVYTMLATCSFQFGEGKMAAFARPGIGFCAAKGYGGFAWTLETGFAVLLN